MCIHKMLEYVGKGDRCVCVYVCVCVCMCVCVCVYVCVCEVEEEWSVRRPCNQDLLP